MLRGRRRENGKGSWRMAVAEEGEGEGGVMVVDLVDVEGAGRDSRGGGVIIELVCLVRERKRNEKGTIETQNSK